MCRLLYLNIQVYNDQYYGMFSELIRQFILRNKLLLGKTIFIIMGSLLTRLLTAFESCLKTEYRILILGLDAAGMKNSKSIHLFQIYDSESIHVLFRIFFTQFYQLSYFPIFDQNIVKTPRVFNNGCFKGKTTILYQFKLNEKIKTIPTIGFNVETVSPMKGVSFTVWDLGGSGKVIPLWKLYYKNTHGQYRSTI